MRPIGELLQELRRRDVKLWLQDGRLQYAAPKDRLTPDLKAELIEAKPRLIDLLSQSNGKARKAPGGLIASVPRDGHLPLSLAQQRLWYQEQLRTGSDTYNIRTAFRLEGRLNLEALQRSFREIVRRHEVLRTTFAAREDGVEQLIAPEIDLQVRVAPLQLAPGEELQEKVQEAVQEEGRRPFDLAAGPLIRVSLLRIGSQDHVLALTLHHIVSDAWSMRILGREFAELYQAFSQGRPSPLEELPIQFADYAHWHRSLLEAGELDRQIGYWRDRLQGLPPLLELPYDRPRPAAQRLHNQTSSFTLQPALQRSLSTLSSRVGASLFMTLMAAFQVLLARYSGRRDFAVGSLVSTRSQRRLESLIGFFVNTLVLRSEVRPGLAFEELLVRVKEQVLQSRENLDVPFDRIVSELNPERTLSHAPIVQVLLTYNKTGRREVSLPGLKISQIFQAGEGLEFDLAIRITESGQALHSTVQYNPDLFDPSTIERLEGHYRTLLEAFAADPSLKVGQAPLLTQKERQAVVEGFNQTQCEIPPGPVDGWIQARAGQLPDSVALVQAGAAPEAEVQLSYGELSLRSSRLAGLLRSMGVEAETPSALCMPRSIEAIIGMLGLLKAGGVYIPLDPEYPAERLSFMLRDSRAKLLLAPFPEPAFAPPDPIRTVQLGSEGISSDGSLRGWQSEGRPELPAALPDCLAYAIYTSGSTGKPKGVQITHRALANFMASLQDELGLTPSDRMLAVTTFCFDISLLEILLPLIAGARLVLTGADSSSDGILVAELACRHAVTALQGTPSTWRMLLDSGRPLPKGLNAFSGGEALPQELARQLHSRSRSLWNLYGPTETTIWSTCRQIDISLIESCPEGACISIGRPISNTQTYILDKLCSPLPVGIPGELHIGGEGLARGYLGRPALTAGAFVPDPCGGRPGSRLYKTGDLARFRPGADGRPAAIDYLGRIDHQVKLRGFRIELGEVEAALGCHPDVCGAAVALHESASGSRRLVGYVVAAEGTAGKGRFTDSLGEHLAGLLPRYMIPSLFVRLDDLPLTPSGKVDRRALPSPELEQQRAECTAPRTEREEKLARIWQEVLRLPRISIHDNFFALGGDSILSMLVIARARKAGLELTPKMLFQHQTIAQLAPAAGKAALPAAASESAIEPPPQGHRGPLAHSDFPGVKLTQQELDRLLQELDLPDPAAALEDVLALSPIQQGMLYHSLADPESALYVNQFRWRLRGSLDAKAFESAWRQIQARHGVFRTLFPAPDRPNPVQVVLRRTELPWFYRDWRGQDEEALQANLDKLAQQSLRQPFRMDREPLLRLALVRCEDEAYQFIATIHHALLDGWSQAVLMRELPVLYRQAEGADERPLPPVQPLRDYILWLAKRDRAAERDFWRDYLRGFRHPVGFASKSDGAASEKSFRAEELRIDPPASLVQAIRALARRERLTPNIVMQGAWAILLSRYSGRQEALFGVTASGRPPELPGAENMVGPFINTVPARVPVSQQDSALQLLRQLHQDQVERQPFVYTPLIEIQEVSELGGTAPLFESVVVFENFYAGEPAAPRLRAQARPLQVDVLDQSIAVNYPLTLAIAPAKGLALNFRFHRAIFDPSEVRLLAERYLALLEELVTDARRPVGALSFFTEQDRLALAALNPPVDEPPPQQLVHEVVAAQAERQPHAAALTWQGIQLSFREMDENADRLAVRLQEMGVGPEVLVGILLERSPASVVSMLGILKAGGAFLPMDPVHPEGRIAFMAEDSGIRLLITQQSLFRQAAGMGLSAVLLNQEGRIRGTQPSEEARLPIRPDLDNLAYVIYTSGSTGIPKGTLLTHRGFYNFAAECIQIFLLSSSCRFLQMASHTFDGSLLEMYPPLCAGASLCILDPRKLSEEQAGASPSRAFQDSGVTHGLFPPSFLAKLPPSMLEPLETLVTGGEACSAELARRFSRDWRFINVYGPTEATVVATAADCRGRMGIPPIGRPLRHFQVYVLDQILISLPPGIPGELFIGGIGLARGYLKRPSLTAERYVPDPYSGELGGRLYKSGDLVRYAPNGEIEFLRRIDLQVKLRGYRIELGEVEAWLCRHPQVGAAAALIWQDRQGQSHLGAFVTPRGQSQIHEEVLMEFLKANLPDYMVPAAILKLAAMPLAPSGKLNREALPADAFREAGKQRRVLPRTETEKALAAIWEELLPVDQVGVHDDFFSLGGHSLLASQAVARIREILQLNLPVKALFASPTVARLAAEVDALLEVASAQGVEQEDEYEEMEFAAGTEQ